jgi:hypothetical protein
MLCILLKEGSGIKPGTVQYGSTIVTWLKEPSAPQDGQVLVSATGVTDLTPGRPARLLEVLPGRTGKVYAGWLAAREPGWKDRIRFAALDRPPSAGTPPP